MRIRVSVRHSVIALGLVALAGGLSSHVAFGQGSPASGDGVISQGNLFSPTRRPWTPPPPPEPPKAANPQPPPPPPQFVLYGVLIMGDERTALLKEPQLTSGKVQEVPLGAQVGPYRLSRIEAGHVVLEKDGTSMTVAVEDPARTKGQVVALPVPALAPGTPPPPPMHIPAPQPSAPPPGSEPSPIQKLTDVFSQFTQRLGLPPPGQ